MTYAGDVDVKGAWNALSVDKKALLIDVRCRAEISFVGVPDLSSLNKKPVNIEWQSFPAMELNKSFAGQLDAALTKEGGDKDRALYFLCRSGGRSASAAHLAAERGYTKAYNISNGFEGGLDGNRHRNTLNGWRAQGLPWVQN